ncbi:lactonase family protein [Granulicatella seriolae]|uniref:Lactonase family protein n=1 Tax=Granulicatella seriolae TaxID=2967226 RepID=A0ABT1WL34_9LACT|nr:lactonase family protein [Granulicatella seriolae]
MKEKFYLGTYTKRESKGVYSIELDTSAKSLGNLVLEAEVDSPTYVTLDSSKNLLYTVSKEEGLGGVTSFKRDTTGQFVKVDQDHFEIAPPCYISLEENSSLLVTSNYHAGSVVLYQTDSNGKLDRLDLVEHTGSSIHPNQTKPHVHYSQHTPDNHFIIACDLGTDEVITYKVSPDQELRAIATYKSSPGAGPRHIVFHPTLSIAYLICELNASIEVLFYDTNTGEFVLKDRVDLLKDDNQEKWAAAIRITADGRFLYASNRGYDVLVSYLIHPETGLLTFIEEVATYGKVARDFNLSQNDDFIVVAHQESDNLSLFERDSQNGKLTLLESDVYAPEAVCVYL